MNVAPKDKNAWLWIPFLYFTQGIPYILVVTVSVIMYKRLGIGNAEIGLYTSWLYLPWVIKPLWSPLVDLNGTKRKWFLGMQLLISFAFLGIGLFLASNSFFIITLAFFWMAAFASATNDIASDGYYMIGLTQKKTILLYWAEKHILPIGHGHRARTTSYFCRLLGKSVW